ncbi:MAG TPA: helicase-related protein, partial [Spirochaetota bacterium]|nr:helicase-related protein [Spirochaetota bacterium]
LVDLRHIKIFVLDEADRMLDMGFFNDVKKIISKLPIQKQTLLFSATMPTEIETLADSLLVNPSKIEVNPVSSTVEVIKQSVYFVNKSDKKRLLLHLLKDTSIRSALVFSRTKHGSNRIAEDLNKAGIYAEAIHGNKSQNARQKALSNFKSKQTRVLVATDIAARGIDIDELSHVINFDIPNVPETYVHRIGRTGRAGEAGTAISFCDEEEKSLLKDINKLISKQIDIVIDHPFPMKDEVISDKNDIFNKKNLKKIENVKKTASGSFNSRPSSKKISYNSQLSKEKVEKTSGLLKKTPVNNKKDTKAKENVKKIFIKLDSNNNSNKKSYTSKNKREYVQ